MPDAGGSKTGHFQVLFSGARFGQFASVGIVGALLDFTVLILLAGVADVPALIAKLVSIEVAILVMFAINERWTFATEGETGTHPVLRRLARSHAVRAAGTVTQLSVFAVVSGMVVTSATVFGVDPWLLATNAIAIGTGFVLNYTFETLWTWQAHREG